MVRLAKMIEYALHK
ncbi:hypothetical protein CGLO_07748 [Colletotrichum gloeosporioides Cg-14]|uniref:Uncharacterized protein n=1 Tax=Colletotrichum gloeosporioides (strain Cg-14) TaxID=1237896 RepID=T0KKY3_COLGC|nr:hypothetical protein CGLO_07748 [Colletotrichum gloeosporioides Cg-14]